MLQQQIRALQFKWWQVHGSPNICQLVLWMGIQNENDFCKGCFWCKGAPKIISCDGTKIGIGFKNAFVAPIENAEKRAPANALSPRRLD